MYIYIFFSHILDVDFIFFYLWLIDNMSEVTNMNQILSSCSFSNSQCDTHVSLRQGNMSSNSASLNIPKLNFCASPEVLCVNNVDEHTYLYQYYTFNTAENVNKLIEVLKSGKISVFDTPPKSTAFLDQYFDTTDQLLSHEHVCLRKRDNKWMLIHRVSHESQSFLKFVDKETEMLEILNAPPFEIRSMCDFDNDDLKAFASKWSLSMPDKRISALQRHCPHRLGFLPTCRLSFESIDNSIRLCIDTFMFGDRWYTMGSLKVKHETAVLKDVLDQIYSFIVLPTQDNDIKAFQYIFNDNVTTVVSSEVDNDQCGSCQCEFQGLPELAIPAKDMLQAARVAFEACIPLEAAYGSILDLKRLETDSDQEDMINT